MALGLAGIKSNGIFFAGGVLEAGRDTGRIQPGLNLTHRLLESWNTGQTTGRNQPDDSGVEGLYPAPRVSDRAELCSANTLVRTES